MNLEPGMRLSNGTHHAYEVVGAAWSSLREAFFQARRVFWNLRHLDRTIDEAGTDEGLDVLVRSPLDPDEGDLTFECEKVYAAVDTPWFLDLIDLLPRPDSPETGTPRSLLVLADPHARRLADGPPSDRATAARLIRLGIETAG